MTEPAEQERAAAVPTSQHAIIEVTQAGIVTSWNPGAVLLYGYTEEEMVGQSRRCSARQAGKPRRSPLCAGSSNRVVRALV